MGDCPQAVKTSQFIGDAILEFYWGTALGKGKKEKQEKKNNSHLKVEQVGFAWLESSFLQKWTRLFQEMACWLLADFTRRCVMVVMVLSLLCAGFMKWWIFLRRIPC